MVQLNSLIACSLLAASFVQTVPVQYQNNPQAGGKFGFRLPNFTGGGAMTQAQYVTKFAASMSNPGSYLIMITFGVDLRLLNPGGVYLKHINLRTLVDGDLSHPDYDWIHANHPEWIIRDALGNTVPLFTPSEECVDFGNDAYLDYVLNTWMPNTYLDTTDDDPGKTTYYLHDNGNFRAQVIDCAGEPCATYTTDAGMQTAWKHMLDRWRAKWPNKKIFVSTGLVANMTPAEQLPAMKDVLAHADGYFCESLTSDHVYWSGAPNNQKRNALEATMQLADWLADNGKYFFPNLGIGGEPTQAETDYGFAFFNLMRRGDRQFYSQVNEISGGLWQPEVYAEMTLSLGPPLEERQQISTNVYRRQFQNAIAYVNLSDSSASITLPAGTYENSLGASVVSPLIIASFSGLTIYKQ